jgi:hypothetical protein
MQKFADRFGVPMQPGQPGKPGAKPQRPAQKGQAVGTGFIIDEKGWIVTNHHVVGKADEIVVTLADGRKLPAKLMGGDEKTDIALLKVESRQAAAVRLVRRRRQGARRPAGDGGRQPVRPRRHRDDGHRVGARPRHPVRSVRRLHPDRRRDQPRQLRRPAVRHGRQGDRHQHRDLLAVRRQRRPRLRHPARPGRRWSPSSRSTGGSARLCSACRSSR